MRHLVAAASALALALGVTTAATASPGGPPSPPGAKGWQTQVVDTDQSFRGLDAVDGRTAWVTGGSVSDGGAGSVYRTTDAGWTWQDVRPPGSQGLAFRDVEARDARTASVLAIGPGEASRIYRTTDGGQTWRETFRNREEAAFYNCIAFAPGGRVGLGVSDPVDGRFRIIRTTDGGASWRVLPSRGMPDSTGEANFAASGDCLTMSGRTAVFGSGGERSRVFRSDDLGTTWRASSSGIPAGEAAGVFALALRTPRQGVAVGGDFSDPADGSRASSVTRDGRTWRTAGDLPHLGEDVEWLSRHRLLVVGEGGGIGGTSASDDGGRTWRLVDPTAWHTLDCERGTCWAAGGGGRVGRW